MTREEALALATRWVDANGEAPRNERGYVRDGHKPPTMQEKLNAVLQLADWLLAEENACLHVQEHEQPPRAHPGPPTTVNLNPPASPSFTTVNPHPPTIPPRPAT